MSRKDNWSQSDDSILAETVLAYVRSGNTQLKAFDEVSKKLGRTPGACAFRWNSTVRKQYETQLQEAKQQKSDAITKKEKARHEPKTSITVKHPNPFEELTTILEKAIIEHKKLQRDYAKLQREYSKLQKKLEEQLQSEDLDTLLQIIHRAKEIGVIKESSA